MNRAAKGSRTEHKSRDLLSAAGYTVTRAAASKGAFDLIALAAVAVPANCRRVVHRWRDRCALPDVREV